MFKIKNTPIILLVITLSINIQAQQIADNNSIPTAKPNNRSIQFHPLAPRIIIKYKEGSNEISQSKLIQKSKNLSNDMGMELKFEKVISGGAHIVSLDSNAKKIITQEKLQEFVSNLNKRKDIKYAEIDALNIPYINPNDTLYNTQWHYYETAGGMRLPNAWDITTGTGTTVAVLDTGYLPHNDLVGNIVAGYDMISDAAIAGDGDGRDSNAEDFGDFTPANKCQINTPARNSSWHGTHVAGTIAAVSNNNNDVTGVAWDVSLLPVRVLGKCGGLQSDITDGIRWAAGLSVPGVPLNSNPADVINLSLGSSVPSTCSASYQSAIDDAVNAGVTVVVASGNDNSSQGYPPANCNNVVSVAATNRNGARAYYSNYGSDIDVAAPGGEICAPISNGLIPQSLSDCQGGIVNAADMIQSTYNTGLTNPVNDSIGTLQGTSMAAPHVAGLVALMYSVNPNTIPADVESVLKSSARSFPVVGVNQCTTSNCGSGIVDATAAVNSMLAINSVLVNNTVKSGLFGVHRSEKTFTLEVPVGATDIGFNLYGGTGDADLYVKFGSAPSRSNFDCRSWEPNNTEVCKIQNPQAGTYYVMIYSYKPYSGVSLSPTYAPASIQQNIFSSSTRVNIPDNNPVGVTSNINVSRTGNAGNVEITYNIIHTYRGDLTVEIIAPNGASAILRHSNGSDSANDIHESVTVAAGSISANGNWGLRVIDTAGADIGYIESWSIEFL